MGETEPTRTPDSGSSDSSPIQNAIETLSDRLWSVQSTDAAVRRRGQILILLQVILASILVVSMSVWWIAGVQLSMGELSVALSSCVVCGLGILSTRRGHVDLTGLIVSTLVMAALGAAMLRTESTSPFGWLVGLPVLLAAFSVRPPLMLIAYGIGQSMLIGVEFGVFGADLSTLDGRHDVVLMSLMLLVLASTSWLYCAANERMFEERSRAHQASEEALVRAEQALADAERSRTEALVLHTSHDEVYEPRLATDLPHEMRTLVYVFIRYGEVFAEIPVEDLSDPGRGLSGPALQGLIDRSLRHPRMEAAGLQLEVGPVAVENVLRQKLAEVEPAARQRNNVIRAWLQEGLGSITTDATRLRQIVALLLSNALKFTERGEIHVRASRLPNLGELRLEVEDTGIGIAQEHLEEILDGFDQVDVSTTRRYGALVACSALCRALGGTLAARSTPGEGSTFTVCLPAEPPPDVITPDQHPSLQVHDPVKVRKTQ